ncbi:hypothetical protein N7462_004183 [Penicillium macrosclerotiorum]|uniref:uncharacterized protein n=1 Tax=Penicillium macrosclerotiorum TaxID=303699 RepID=UPI0025467FD8|nr:uncharacterized protein N7462_004183 [Penicillium macrosclerotiorum]KAJ5689791.1 hypothetical protein N7462_004183 [Penicillium macrosclerotiorum]
MDLHLKPQLPLTTPPRATSATLPLTHGSALNSRPNDQPTSQGPFAGQGESARADRRSSRHPHHIHHGTDQPPSPDSAHPDSRPRSTVKPLFEPLGPDAPKPHHRHKHSKSRELRLPRPMSQLASSASARGLLPTWSRERDREGDDGLLRPITRETTPRSRWGSDSTSGVGSSSRKGSLLDTQESHERLGPIRRQEIQSMNDLEQVKKRRKQGEEYLRSALSSIGTLATDVTRRLDYTYYNLLEKITALNSTIGSFQELSESASTLLNNFERETAGLDQEIRKQINDLKGFEPQIRKADALEERMKNGRQKVETLSKRLESVRHEIDRWEQRETEWQSRISRRLRIFWATVVGALVVLILALLLQNWPAMHLSHRVEDPTLPTEVVKLVQGEFRESGYSSETWDSILEARDSPGDSAASWYPSTLEDRRRSLARVQGHATNLEQTRTSSHIALNQEQTVHDHDPLRLLDEL